MLGKKIIVIAIIFSQFLESNGYDDSEDKNQNIDDAIIQSFNSFNPFDSFNSPNLPVFKEPNNMIAPFNSIPPMLDLWQFSLFGSKPKESNVNPTSNAWANDFNETQSIWPNEMSSFQSLPSLPSLQTLLLGQYPPKILQNENSAKRKSDSIINNKNNLLQNPFSFLN